MTALSEDLRNEIEATIYKLTYKEFTPDQIAGEHFSKITSVMSSAYKRHGFILERAILEAVSQHPNFEAWEDKDFEVSTAADSVATDFMQTPEKALLAQVPYSTGERTLQIDLAAFNKSDGSIRLYEVKRGNETHDAGKKRQMLRDLLCMQLLAQSYAVSKGFSPVRSGAFIIFYYGKMSLKGPFGLKGTELDGHFGFEISAKVEAANALYKKRLLEILTEK